MPKQRFEAPIMAGRGGGAYVVVPFDVGKVFGTRRLVRVKGTIDGRPFKSSMAPMGGGQHVLGLHKATRDAVGKAIGDSVAIMVEPDTDVRTVAVPDDFREALGGNKTAQERFDGLAYTHRKEYVEWVESARRPETRQRRITEAVSRIARGTRRS